MGTAFDPTLHRRRSLNLPNEPTVTVIVPTVPFTLILPPSASWTPQAHLITGFDGWPLSPHSSRTLRHSLEHGSLWTASLCPHDCKVWKMSDARQMYIFTAMSVWTEGSLDLDCLLSRLCVCCPIVVLWHLAGSDRDR